jgi:protein O-GlcNAcase/histone acetyltransferase
MNNEIYQLLEIRINDKEKEDKELQYEDLALLCDLFYLPFEHGAQGLQILQEFNWLKSNAHLVALSNLRKHTRATSGEDSPEVLYTFLIFVNSTR